MKITSCTISKQPTEMFDPLPVVNVTYEDGSNEDLFSYYPDEIYFSSHEFLGLTREEAFTLFHKKDVCACMCKVVLQEDCCCIPASVCYSTTL